LSEISYPSYLELDALLALQHPRSAPEHPDELLFIIVHQSSELWFKLILHELDRLCAIMAAGDVLSSLESLQRVNGLMRIVTAQLHALDTLSPQQFSQFRTNLGTSSGSQSAQFRAIELLSGLRAPEFLEYVRSSGPLDPRVADALDRPSLPELFNGILRVRGVEPRDVYASDAHRDLRLLAEALLSYEQEFGMWRYLHVQLVERIIGPGTAGTGGSLGAASLRATLSNRFFPELWAVRAEFY
jgi:tryptophan 2,3-dioxygenase